MAVEQSQAVEPSIAEAARRAAVDAEAKTQSAKAAIELRDGWVPKLVDAGYGYAEVARILLVSRSRVMQILARVG